MVHHIRINLCYTYRSLLLFITQWCSCCTLCLSTLFSIFNEGQSHTNDISSRHLYISIPSKFYKSLDVLWNVMYFDSDHIIGTANILWHAPNISTTISLQMCDHALVCQCVGTSHLHDQCMLKKLDCRWIIVIDYSYQIQIYRESFPSNRSGHEMA